MKNKIVIRVQQFVLQLMRMFIDNENSASKTRPTGKILSTGAAMKRIPVFTLLLSIPLLLVGPLAAQDAQWNATGSMNVARLWHTSTLLTNGKVLIVGGATTTTELYDPAAGNFSLTGNTLYMHGYGATATRLADGKVLQTTAVAELYDPIAGTFQPTGSLNESRMEHTATLLPSGKVLVTARFPGQRQLIPAVLGLP